MANEGYIRQLTTERVACPSCGGSGHTAHGHICETCGGSGTIGGVRHFGPTRNTVFAAVILTIAGVVLVWVFMFLLSQG